MKRFYRDATLGTDADGYRVLLDGRAIRTPGGRAQIVPTAALGAAMVAEWADQPEMIDPANFVLRDMADFAIDAIAPRNAETVAALLAYAETDTLCYRAHPDEPFAVRQNAVWEPLLKRAETRLGVQFVRVAGIMHQPQPAATLVALNAQLSSCDPFALAALRNLASLSASLIIALAALEPDAELSALWDAAHLEEHWQAELWGNDADAAARLERRRAVFIAAARFAGLAQSP